MKKAFTLIELLMVIAILGIISTLAVSKIGNLRRNSAMRVSLANQSAVSRAVESFIMVNPGKLNRLDALMYKDGISAEGSAGFDFALTNMLRAAGNYLYQGPAEPVVPDERHSSLNWGLAPELRTVLVPYALTEKEAQAFSGNLGLSYVMCHTKYGDGSPRAQYGNAIAEGDGTYLPDTEGIGWDAQRAACIPQPVTNGIYLAAISPASAAGRQVYRDCGQELLDTEMQDNDYNAVKASQEARASGGVLFAFGLGESCSAVGKGRAGLEAAPYSEFPMPKFYRRYILLFRLDIEKSAVPEFAGVLDPLGQTIRAARRAVDAL